MSDRPREEPMFKIQNRRTKEIAAVAFDSKMDAWKHLIMEHGITWDRRWRILAA